MSTCVMHCGFRYLVQTPGRILHCISCTIDRSRKNLSILNRQWHNHGLPSMRTVLSDFRCDSSSTERQSRSLSRKSSVSSRGNVRKTSGSMYTKSHLEKRKSRIACYNNILETSSQAHVLTCFEYKLFCFNQTHFVWLK